jgi:hypothetical protein
MQIYFQISDTNLKKCVRVGGIKNENAFCDRMVCRERDGIEKRRYSRSSREKTDESDYFFSYISLIIKNPTRKQK